MSVLYINPQGKEVTHSSYSSRQTFKHCPREFELTRIQGYQEKGQRAAPMFGKCVEAGVQAYEENGRAPGKAGEVFERLWNDVKTLPDFKELQFTDSEGDWDGLLRAGREMMLIYEIRAPFLPISTHPKALWQQVLRKKIFPGTALDKLENKAVFDILSFPRWNHGMLPASGANMNCNDCANRWSSSLESDGPKFEPCQIHETRTLIIDMKTSGEDLNTELVILDPQLAEYAWMARVPDLAFLWFVKKSHGLKKGSRITLLQEPEHETFHAGFELVVLTTGENDDVFVGNHAALDEYDAALKGLRGKARDAVEAKHLVDGIASGKLLRMPLTGVSKQRLQFGAARLTEQDMNEIGRDVAQTTVEMVRAHTEGYYPRLSGIRFPNQKCNYCSMRWICLNKPEQRDQHLTRKGEEWLDGMELE